ncbi:MAG: glycoside hydrolase family 65 protein [Solirubrobacterales bacterium]|nr:glycoside hydrolase family 65 protein [Solirubrobacterales bacterium]
MRAVGDDHWPIEEWCIREPELDLDQLARAESIFALSNGHLGLRGNLDEGEPRGISGTYVNGFYESYPLEYGESGYGFAEDGQSVVNVQDGKVIHLMLEDEPVDVLRGEVLAHERVLDFRTGTLDRSMHYRSTYGREVKIRTRRLVSFVQRSVAAIEYEIEAVNAPMRVALQSNLLANMATTAEGDDPRKGKDLGAVLEPRFAQGHELRAVLVHSTPASLLTCASGMEHVIDENGQELHTDVYVEDDKARVTISAELEPGQPLRFVKFMAYHWSSRQSPEFLRDQVAASLANACAEGWDGLLKDQKKTLDWFWSRADVTVDGDPAVQQALRFSLFHLFQAGARIEGRAIPAKGLTGPGYDGHAFWDTETFVLPVLTYVLPDVVRHALLWRHSILPMADARSELFGMEGALMPWRTIRGQECSGYWPAGSAALHINGDIADAVRRYVDATGDDDFEGAEGGELLVATARLWMSAGCYDRDSVFRIDGVTGPDEYSALVDNNVFTNLGARANLRAAAVAVEHHAKLAQRLEVSPEEAQQWRAAAHAMYIPYDEAVGIHPQDQDFLLHQPWDFEATSPEEYPLLLHFPYFQLYRTQVIKQADLVLAMHLYGEEFTPEQKRRNFDYYEGLTVRDSSLSACTQAIMAAEVGHMELAHDYLREAAFVDLHNLHHNTGDGLHIASLAGAVMAVTNGYGGMRDSGGRIRFCPRLPRGVGEVSFAVCIRGSLLRVTIDQEQARYQIEEGAPLDFTHWGEEVHVTKSKPVTLPTPEVEDLPRPAQPAGREPVRHTG